MRRASLHSNPQHGVRPCSPRLRLDSQRLKITVAATVTTPWCSTKKSNLAISSHPTFSPKTTTFLECLAEQHRKIIWLQPVVNVTGYVALWKLKHSTMSSSTGSVLTLPSMVAGTLSLAKNSYTFTASVVASKKFNGNNRCADVSQQQHYLHSVLTHTTQGEPNQARFFLSMPSRLTRPPSTPTA